VVVVVVVVVVVGVGGVGVGGVVVVVVVVVFGTKREEEEEAKSYSVDAAMPERREEGFNGGAWSMGVPLIRLRGQSRQETLEAFAVVPGHDDGLALFIIVGRTGDLWWKRSPALFLNKVDSVVEFGEFLDRGSRTQQKEEQ